MASNGTNGANGANGANSASHRFDPHFTQHVLDTMGPNVTPRNKVVLGALIRHIHDFAREVELTIDEWMVGVHFVNSVGQISTKIRNESLRVSDILGLESLVDEIAHSIVSREDLDPTSSSILGPFWSPHAPFRPLGSPIIVDPVPPNGQVALMHGTIRDMVTGKPIPGAVLDIWQASANGRYDFQDPDNQSPNNLRGKFRAGDDGRYSLLCLHPTAYSLPRDGPSFALLNALDRHPMRPAHIHIMVTAEGYQGCTTQLYPKGDPWLETDTVFAVKDDLVVDFKPFEKTEGGGDGSVDGLVPTLDLLYDVVIAPAGYMKRDKDVVAEAEAVASGSAVAE